MKAAIIIPVHNSIDYTRKSLQRLMSSLAIVDESDWQFPVIVVDDGSTDGTSEWLDQHYPQIHLCQGDGNLWWSGAINMGMKYALEHLKADYIIWWNNDILPAYDYFQNVIRLLNEFESPVVIGSKIYFADQPDLIWCYGGYFHKFWGHSYMPGNGQNDGQTFSIRKEADWLPGMGTIFHREIIEKTGMLNFDDFPQYHSDIDYCCRTRIMGYKVIVVPELRIWNHTEHSGRSHEFKFRKLIPGLYDIKSIHHFNKEWKLYRKYAPTPLAYMILVKKYIGYFVKFALGRGKSS